MTNTQPPERQELDPTGLVEVHSIFRTIQGEGPFVGFPSVFVRLRGCNLQCPQCDTEYFKGSTKSPFEIINQIRSLTPKSELIVISGGEPFRQNIGPLVTQLVNLGYHVQIETNGTLYVPGPWAHERVSIVCSPKTPKIHPKLQQFIMAYKYVGSNGRLSPEDGLPITVLGRLDKHHAGPVARPHREGIPVYLQPCDWKDPDINKIERQAVVNSCLDHGHILCLQIHKILDLE